jgi:hypothetical protein
VKSLRQLRELVVYLGTNTSPWMVLGAFLALNVYWTVLRANEMREEQPRRTHTPIEKVRHEGRRLRRTHRPSRTGAPKDSCGKTGLPGRFEGRTPSQTGRGPVPGT